ncbi:RNA helicase, putative [Eimeria tenella]|uniref:RNA helicase, putative n=1 Tax=Eimeria tenella TaxID=5802 RepID=U6KRX7_EIMTE|nr:RNA helicase, putative [Eimeria tenella]CDJ39673.1 RNA helicase, putative [Eimeria tenella]|eukprot:XP_013230428.1 RNA helicase, putative [Eimeria tenella]
MYFVESELLHCHCEGLLQEFVAVAAGKTLEERVLLLLGALEGPLRGLKTLVFCNTAATAKRVAELLQQKLQQQQQQQQQQREVLLFTAQLAPLARAKVLKKFCDASPSAAPAAAAAAAAAAAQAAAAAAPAAAPPTEAPASR